MIRNLDIRLPEEIEKENIDEITEVYNKWICIHSHDEYVFGGEYWFFQDVHPGGFFALCVNDNNEPITQRVRIEG